MNVSFCRSITAGRSIEIFSICNCSSDNVKLYTAHFKFIHLFLGQRSSTWKCPKWNSCKKIEYIIRVKTGKKHWKIVYSIYLDTFFPQIYFILDIQDSTVKRLTKQACLLVFGIKFVFYF